MDMVFSPLSNLLPITSPYANGCPSFMLEQAMRFAAIEMCERGRIWRHMIEFDARSAVNPDLIPAEACIFEFDYALADGRKLQPVQHTTIAEDGILSGTPQFVSQYSPWGIIIHPWPDDSQPIPVELSVFLKPRSDTLVGVRNDDPMFDSFNVVPDWMVTQHSHRLADGALARVLLMEGQPWFNPKRAMDCRARFDEALKRLSSSSIRGQQRAPVRTPYVDM